jgi:hypothetical protein
MPSDRNRALNRVGAGQTEGDARGHLNEEMKLPGDNERG